MILDLAGRGSVNAAADWLVVGAGTVGLPVSVLLARIPGCSVVCLESGVADQESERHPLNEVVHRASHYSGADDGRFRCLGGTSTRWGGALIPFQDADFNHGDWPLDASDLDPYVARVEEIFGLEPGPYEDRDFPYELGRNHVNRLAKWPVFRKRNVVNLFGAEAKTSRNLTVWTNATVTEILVLSDTGGLEVVAHSDSGDRIKVAAKRLIIAAGAVETTRLALLIDRLNAGIVTKVSPDLGRFFCDHISIAVAEIDANERSVINRTVGWRFGAGGSMRNIRFELAADAKARGNLPPSFIHISPKSSSPSGFDALREFFRVLQRHRLPSAGVIFRLLRHAPWLVRALWWRYVEKRLLFPENCRLAVTVVQEQALCPHNRITLSDTRTDQFGVPLAEIDWRVTEMDLDHISRSADLFEEAWNGSGLAALGTLQRYPREDVLAEARDSGGVYHPTGSTPMANSPKRGVVDRDLRMFSVPQIQLLSTSVLPTGGGTNPTMLLLMLALRCVDQHRNAQG